MQAFYNDRYRFTDVVLANSLLKIRADADNMSPTTSETSVKPTTGVVSGHVGITSSWLLKPYSNGIFYIIAGFKTLF